MKCYWINLLEATDRASRIKCQFMKENIKRSFNNKNSTTYISKRVDSIKFKPGHIGCCLSHIRAIYNAYSDGNEIAVIMEDDLDFTFEDLDIAFNLVEKLPDDWEVFQVHYIEPKLIQSLNNVKHPESNIIFKGYFMSAACYIINRKGMERFLTLMTVPNKGDYNVSVDLSSPMCKSEEMIFRYLNSYVSLFPIVNTFENNNSQISTAQEYMINNYNNMIETGKFRENFSREFFSKTSFINLPYDLHWFQKEDDAKKFLERCYGKRRECLTFLHSGLGNRLFQYFSVYGIAKKNNIDFDTLYSAYNYQHINLRKDSENYQDFFQLKNTSLPVSIATNNLMDVLSDSRDRVLSNAGIPKESIIILREPVHLEGQCIDFSESLKENKTYVFSGYFQNENYFIEYRNDVRNFIMKSRPNEILDSLSQNIFKNLYAIHVRIGDYYYNDYLRNKHFVNLNKYYMEAMKIIKNKNPEARFIVVCEEKDFSKIISIYPSLEGLHHLINNLDNELLDFFFMVECEGVICSNSTFAWWAAWLNNGTRIIPNKWFNHNDRYLDMKNCIILNT